MANDDVRVHRVGYAPGSGPNWPETCAECWGRFRAVAEKAAFAVVGCNETSEDIASEVFFSLLKTEPTEAREFSRQYFAKAARNRALNWIETQERQRGKLERLSSECRPGIPRPEEDLERARVRRLVREEVSQLRGRRYTVAWMSWVEGRSLREIAETLGVGVKRVERHRQAARRALEARLRTRLRGGGGGTD
jgi:RNA polymerase sigma-70 factor, ECF subfamily